VQSIGGRSSVLLVLNYQILRSSLYNQSYYVTFLILSLSTDNYRSSKPEYFIFSYKAFLSFNRFETTSQFLNCDNYFHFVALILLFSGNKKKVIEVYSRGLGGERCRKARKIQRAISVIIHIRLSINIFLVFVHYKNCGT
jgi:hypothetical protein